jgi:hypothetical protein
MEGVTVAVKVATLRPGMVGRDGSVGMELHQPLGDASASIVEVEISKVWVRRISFDGEFIKIRIPIDKKNKAAKITANIFCWELKFIM